MKLKTLIAAVVFLCLDLSGSFGLPTDDNLHPNEGGEMEENHFSWEDLFEEPVAPGQLINEEGTRSPDVIAIQSFLVDFGKSLDHCNMKIEETATISKFLIRQFMREVIEKKTSKINGQENSVDDISLDEIDFQEQVAVILDDEFVEENTSSVVSEDIWYELSDILVTLREACDNLPITIADIDLNRQRTHDEKRTETVLDEILRAMTRWTKHWTVQMKTVAGKFIYSCMALPRCENNLKIIADIISNSLEKSKTISMSSSPGINLQSVMGTSAFWNAMSSASQAPAGSDVNNLNSYLRMKLQKMAGILGHFGGLSESEDLEYVHASVGNESAANINLELLEDADASVVSSDLSQGKEESHDDFRMRRMVAAAVNVLRFPWNVDEPNKAVLLVAGDAVLREVPPTFLSLALESKAIHTPTHKFNTRSTKVRALLSQLSPAVFRLGGSSANFLTYDPTNANTETEELSSSSQEITQPIHVPNNYLEPEYLQVYPFAPTYHARNKLSWHQQSSAPVVHSKVSHPKLRKRTNDVREIVDIKLADDPERYQKAMKKHPKYMTSSHKNGNSVHQPVDDDSPSRRKRSAETPQRHHRNVNNPHPKIQQQINSLHQATSKRSADVCQKEPHFTNYTMTDEEFGDLLDMCRSLNWTLLFDLNQFKRTPEGDWDPSNARQIIRAASDKGVHVIWQVGNEPNSYTHKFTLNMTGPRMVRDVERLRKEVHAAAPLWQRLKEDLGFSADVTVVGPDVTRPRHLTDADLSTSAESVGQESMEFLREFLAGQDQLVDALSWHQYYVCGRTATEEQFTSPAVLDVFQQQVQAVSAIRDELAPTTPIWITETGSAFGGGAPGLSNRFAGVFLWLDKLGVAAAGGVQVVARQSLWGGHYAMLGADYEPNPDYWVSVLHKRLVGGRVLQVTLEGAPPTLRLYAHCAKDDIAPQLTGGIVVYGINTGSDSVSVGPLLQFEPNDDSAAPESSDAPVVLQYLLTPALGDLTARTVLLNGRPLVSGEDGSLPSLDPLSVTELSVSGHSAGFWHLPNARVPACQQ